MEVSLFFLSTLGALAGTLLAGFAWFGIFSAIAEGQPVDGGLGLRMLAGLALLAVCLLKDGLLFLSCLEIFEFGLSFCCGSRVNCIRWLYSLCLF